MLIASGILINYPDFLPVTSKVTKRSGNNPSEGNARKFAGSVWIVLLKIICRKSRFCSVSSDPGGPPNHLCAGVLSPGMSGKRASRQLPPRLLSVGRTFFIRCASWRLPHRLHSTSRVPSRTSPKTPKLIQDRAWYPFRGRRPIFVWSWLLPAVQLRPVRLSDTAGRLWRYKKPRECLSWDEPMPA